MTVHPRFRAACRPATRATSRPGAPAGPSEQSRASYPDTSGHVIRDGVRIHYEVHGSGSPPVLMLPTWSIVHSRIWKAQIPFLARHHRVVAFDARGNGRSDRPAAESDYDERAHAADALAVMDATGTGRAVVVALSRGAQRALVMAGEHPDRVAGLVLIAPSVVLGASPRRRGFSFDEPLDSDDGWAKHNRHYWLRDYRGYLDFFFTQAFTEQHSTKQIEDAVGWGMETDPLILGSTLARGLGPRTTRRLCAHVQCPVLVIQGEEDAITGRATGVGLAGAMPGSRLLMLAGSGHMPNARDPIRVNRALGAFINGLERAAT